MSYPSDVLLPINSKFYGFVDPKIAYNAHWDISWSFTFALTGSEHAFCTYLTTNPYPNNKIPGQYLGYLGSNSFILNENNDIIMSENNEDILYDDSSNSSTYEKNGIISIAFDTTGFFALSSQDNVGVGMSNTKKNSLIVRDFDNNVIFNQSLSSLDPSFVISSTNKLYQTLRFRFSNSGKMLYIDKKTENVDYIELASIPIKYNVDLISTLYPAFTFCSPISSNSIQPSTLFLRNFHTSGCINGPTYETIPCDELYSTNTIYTTISGIL